MTAAIRASATPSREDRLFPGDVAQFATAGGGLSFGHGAAGVLYALAESGAERDETAEQWLLDRTAQPPSGMPLGFHDGIAGTAWVLDRLGHRDRSMDLARILVGQRLDRLTTDLHSGTAGIGLALDCLAARTGDTALRDAATRCADLSARPRPRTRRAAAAGPDCCTARRAVPCCSCACTSARATPACSISRATRCAGTSRTACAARGALQVDEGWRTMPYLGAGSVGIGMVLDDYLAHRADEQFERARTEIVRAAQAMFYAQPGLYRGWPAWCSTWGARPPPARAPAPRRSGGRSTP